MGTERLPGRVLVSCDVAVLVMACGAALQLNAAGRGFRGSAEAFERHIWLLWLIVPTWIFVLRRVELYSARYHHPWTRFLGALTKGQALSCSVLFVAIYVTKADDVGYLFVATFLATSFVGVVGGRVSAEALFAFLGRRSKPRGRRALIVGEHLAADHLESLQSSLSGIEVVDVLAPNLRAKTAVGQRLGIGQLAAWSEVLSRYVVDEVIAVRPFGEVSATTGLAAVCAERGLNFRLLSEMPRATVGRYRVEDFGAGTFLVSFEAVPHGTLGLGVKRAIDICGALVGLALCAGAYLAFSRRIRSESPGPVLFRQTRVGRNGRLFTLYKFRTMHHDAETKLKELLPRNEMRGLVFKMKADPRVTPTGRKLRRYYLDELPQFWNVLRGEMSLVGTRPPTPGEVAGYRNHHYRRLSMKPGVTGLWQVAGNGAVRDFEEVVRLDCEYIDTWSLRLDFKVIVQTICKIAAGAGW